MARLRSRLDKENYRKIYLENHGSIPVDRQGRTYDIHHIDGDYTNNHPNNLMAVSLKEHYEIHKQQNDWKACSALAMRIKADLTPKEISELSKKSNQQRISDGTHNFLDGEKNKQIQLNRIKNGTHPFLDINKKRKEEGDIKTSLRQKQKIANGTHPFVDKEFYKKLIAEGKHAGSKVFATLHVCPHCNKEGKGAIMFRFHYNNCKQKS
jgi:HNH endonuclease